MRYDRAGACGGNFRDGRRVQISKSFVVMKRRQPPGEYISVALDSRIKPEGHGHFQTDFSSKHIASRRGQSNRDREPPGPVRAAVCGAAAQGSHAGWDSIYSQGDRIVGPAVRVIDQSDGRASVPRPRIPVELEMGRFGSRSKTNGATNCVVLPKKVTAGLFKTPVNCPAMVSFKGRGGPTSIAGTRWIALGGVRRRRFLVQRRPAGDPLVMAYGTISSSSGRKGGVVKALFRVTEPKWPRFANCTATRGCAAILVRRDAMLRGMKLLRAATNLFRTSPQFSLLRPGPFTERPVYNSRPFAQASSPNWTAAKCIAEGHLGDKARWAARIALRCETGLLGLPAGWSMEHGQMAR